MLRRRLQMAGNGGGSLLPAELQGCEYLETDGNCYIQTNIMPNRFLETIIKIENFQQIESWFLGSRTSNVSNMYVLFTPRELGNLRCDYQSVPIDSTRFSISTTLQQLIIHFNYWDNEQKKVSILDFNGNTLQSRNLNNIAFGGAKEIPIFAGYANPNDLRKALQGTRIYNVEFILHDLNENYNFVSCYIKSGKTYTDNKGNVCGAETCGMYDVINHVFYTNDGTGTFSKGADINL